MTPPADPYRDWDAAYLLGALSHTERRDYEAHLRACRPCAHAVAGFAGLPGLLVAVARDQAAELLTPAPPAGLVRAARLRARFGTAAGVLAATLAGLLVAGWLAGPRRARLPSWWPKPSPPAGCRAAGR
ncbi:anti-sigma factor RsiW [Crossiella equi]|uniref:Anti-sigma factor RsiW n=1 Tax=Crossiella equi TaxID=130796 RepID=A0ABS5AV95_9PSEU|nr:zf-HC2 domain-containing protein [Crossiella equi]MBP2479635.1 anti-sigma factor RsiW [Crossiella equi]